MQIAQLSARVLHLTAHLQQHRKDYACQRGLVAVLAKRKKLLRFLYRQDPQEFARCVRALKIRNPIKGVVVANVKNEADEAPAAAAPPAAAEAAPPAAADAAEEAG